MKIGKPGSYRGSMVTESGERAAEQRARRCLADLGIEAGQLSAMKKSAPEKQAVAWAIKKLTTVSNSWISECLAMGYPTNVTNAVAACRNPQTRQLKQAMRPTRKTLRM